MKPKYLTEISCPICEEEAIGLGDCGISEVIWCCRGHVSIYRQTRNINEDNRSYIEKLVYDFGEEV